MSSSDQQPSRKRKTDSTSDDMGNQLNKLPGPWRSKGETKPDGQPSSSKSAKIEKEEEPSDKIDEVKTAVKTSSTTVLQHGDENAEKKPVKIDEKTEVTDDDEELAEVSALDKTDDAETEPAAEEVHDHGDADVVPKTVREDSRSDKIVIEEPEADTSIVEAPPTLKREDDRPVEATELSLDDTQESLPASSPVKEENTKKEDEDSEAAKVVVKRQASSSSLRSSSRIPKTIADMGYRFNEEGKLRSIEGDNVFKFTTQKAYEQLGDLIGEHVYELMVEAGLERKYFEVGRNRRFYFASPDYARKDRILCLIHGSGVVKAGQWARKLIINESLERGAQLEYIKRGLALGYGIVVLNYNEKCVGQEDRCHSPDGHGVEEWKHAFRRADSEIIVVAHSYGGSIISEVVRRMHRQEDERVLCVALTDSWFSEGGSVFAVNWNTNKRKLSRSNGTYQMYSGDDTHEGTSSACINAVFALFEAVTEDTDVEEFCELLELSEKIIIDECNERKRKKREEKGETASTKSLELVGEKENLAKKAKTAKGDEKENGDKKDDEEAKEEETTEAKEEAKVDAEKEAEEKTEEKQEEPKEKLEVNQPDGAAARERNPSLTEDDSDEGVEKDVSSPEKSENEQ